MEKYQQLLSGLPHELTREYEVHLTNLVKMGKVEEEELQTLVDGFRARKAADPDACTEEEEAVAYAAFYCLNIMYRTHFDPHKLHRVFAQNRFWCKSHESFSHLEVLRYLADAEGADIDEEVILELSHEIVTRCADNAGVQHAFADLYATVCERRPDLQPDITKEWATKAKRAVNIAMQVEPAYAKFYCTKGRILAIDGDFEEADRLVERAIHMENSNRNDYAIRIGSYQYHRLQIQAKKQLKDSHMQEQLDDLKSAATSNIEVLSFFTAVISFVIGSLTLAAGQTAFHAAVLIMILMGALLFVFSVFNFLLHLNLDRVRVPNIVVAVLSALIVLGGILLVR